MPHAMSSMDFSSWTIVIDVEEGVMDDKGDHSTELLLTIFASIWSIMTLGFQATQFLTDRKDRIYDIADKGKKLTAHEVSQINVIFVNDILSTFVASAAIYILITIIII